MAFDYPAALGLKVNELIIQGQLWRLFTPMFLHGSILHIALNMYALLAFGPQLERYYGHGRYLALYLVSGFAGNVASFLFSSAPSLGSSTAIFGLLGAEADLPVPQPQAVRRQRSKAAHQPDHHCRYQPGHRHYRRGIDNWGHIGGLVGGALVCLVWRTRVAGERLYHRSLS